MWFRLLVCQSFRMVGLTAILPCSVSWPTDVTETEELAYVLATSEGGICIGIFIGMGACAYMTGTYGGGASGAWAIMIGDARPWVAKAG